jgi:hypothetical protein
MAGERHGRGMLCVNRPLKSNRDRQRHGGSITEFAAAMAGTRSVADSDIRHVEYRFIKINVGVDF